MESRKMLLMNLSSGRNRKAGVENRLEGTKEEGEVGQIERVAWTYMHDHAGPHIRLLLGSCCESIGAQLSAL